MEELKLQIYQMLDPSECVAAMTSTVNFPVEGNKKMIVKLHVLYSRRLRNLTFEEICTIS